MLTTSRRLACVSSLLARSPRLHRPEQHALLDGRQRIPVVVDALRRDLALLDQLGQPSFVLGREEIDLADLSQVHPHGIGCAAVAARSGLARPAGTTTLEQLLDGLVGR